MEIKAVFGEREAFVHALEALKAFGAPDYDAYGPTNLDEFGHLMPAAGPGLFARLRSGSPVRSVATVGAIIGLVSFFLMCVLSALIYAITTWGKPPWSNVPFVIPTYEGTILIGGIGAFFAVLALARLTGRTPSPRYDRRFSGDAFGIWIACTPESVERYLQMMKDAGAEVAEVAE
jgi:hypothetical protein